jgi:hypothetical protein
MGRLRLRVLTALTVLSLAASAPAAEVTRIASSGEADNPFDVDFQVRWDRLQERGRISREQLDRTRNAPYGSIEDLTELRYRRVRNAMVPRIAVGLHRDLELHVEVPYVLADDASWQYGFRNGTPITDDNSSIGLNGIDANGNACTTLPCPLFAVGSSATVYHGTVLGDVKAGVSWGIFNDQRDDTKPFWLVGVDVTFPSAQRYDPAAGRDPQTFASPATAAEPAQIGDKAWKFDLHTALSRRIGAVDPYFTAHVTLMHASNDTYSNCEHATALASMTPAQFTDRGEDNCDLPQWDDEAGADLPWLAGLAFGTELIPFEDVRQGKKVTIDVRFTADYTSLARWYNPLTDATGKLLYTESHVTFGGQLGLNLRASRYVSLQATASLATQTPYFLTGEPIGEAGGADQNPNYDYRYDAPGSRFRMTETSLFGLSLAGVLQF